MAENRSLINNLLHIIITRFFFVTVLFLLTYASFAQQADSLVAKHGGANSIYFREYKSTGSTDSILDNIHNSFSRNSLGNLGLPNQPFLLGLQDDQLGIRYYSLPFQQDLFKKDGQVFFFSNPIYTNLFASVGQKKEQALNFTHSQLINKKVNIALKFNRYSATGFYVNQLSFVNNLMISSHYKTRNERWGYNMYFLFNKLKYQENGGEGGADSLKRAGLFTNKLLFPVLLQDAKSGFKNMEINFTQLYRINKNSDSSRKTDHFIVYTAGYENNFYQYQEGTPKSGFYKNTYNSYIDSTRTNDSTHLTKYNHEGRYLIREKQEKFMFYAGYKNENTIIYRRTLKSNFTNEVILVGWYVQNRNRTDKLSGEGEYISGGTYLNDYRLKLTAWKKFRFNHSEFISTVLSENRHPDQYYLYNYGNHFRWQNQFLQTETNQAEINYRLTDWKIFAQVNIKNTNHPVYFDKDGLTRQFAGTVNVVRFMLNKDLVIKKIHFNNTINYQLVSDTTFVRLPKIVSIHQLYYQGNLYKNNLQLQVGFQCTYIGSYTANAYMPASNVFYVQNSVKTGNYPYIDLFFNFRIKPVRFFLKVEHINQGFTGANYVLTPGYIQPDRAIKFGFTWLFWD
jgi:hypothetical protein